VDVARAHVQLGSPNDAVIALMYAEAAAPQVDASRTSSADVLSSHREEEVTAPLAG
jgi:hypothetical protein